MNVYLVWLEWPEACFRASDDTLRHLRTLVPRGSRIVRVKTEDEFLATLPRATHALVWHFRKEWFARASRLKVLATPSAGRELVTQEVPPGVTLHFGHFHGPIMAESVCAFVLAWARGFFRPEARLPWGRVELGDKCRAVAGSRAAIIGYGKIGRAIGAKLTALGMQVEGFSRANIAEFPSAAARADWVILSLPSGAETDNFLDAKRLVMLRPGAVVINVGRGNAIDETALCEALRAGRLAGAYLDVFKGEPGPLNGIVGSGRGFGILKLRPRQVPWNLIRMPHASAFAEDYLRRFQEELKNDGCL